MKKKVAMIIGAAVLLLALVYFFWKPLSKRMGIPRTIITLFFIYLCLAAQLYHMDVSMLLSNVLVRVGMFDVLVLVMLPGIQCGIGLNMGMTLGCIAGLLSTVIALQYDLTGYPALIFAVVIGALIALPLGWAYSKLLNRMKGDEMTISTYVGYSFVSLMCIGWMLLPFTNTKIIWLLSGRGLRVTHSLLGSFAQVWQLAGGQTLAFMVLALSQVIHSFNMRSSHSLLKTGIFTNTKLNGAAAISILLVLLVLFTPLSIPFGLIMLPADLYVKGLILVFVPVIVMELAKALKLAKH